MTSDSDEQKEIVPLQKVRAELESPQIDIARFNAYDQLGPELQQAAQQMAGEFDIDVSDLSVTTFGSGAQANAGRVLDPIVRKITNRQLAGPTGTALNRLLRISRGLDVSMLDREPSPWIIMMLDSGKRWVVNIGFALSPLAKFINDAKSVNSTLEAITRELQEEMQGRIDRTADLEIMQQENTEAFWKVMTVVAAGELVLQRERQELEDMQSQLLTSTDPTLPQRVQEHRDRLFRMEVRVLDLKNSAIECFITGPVVRETKKGVLISVDQLQKGLMQTIPQIKRQIIIVVALLEQQGATRKAMALDEAHRATTRRLGELLGQAGTEMRALITSKSEDVVVLEELFGKLVDQIKDLRELESQLDQISVEGDAAYHRMRNRLKEVVGQL